MSANQEERPSRSLRSILLIFVTSIALSSATFTVPVTATEQVSSNDSWQAIAEDASATPTELAADVADGSLNLVVVRDIEGTPDFETVHLSSRLELTQKLAELRADPSVLAVDESKVVRVSSSINVTSVSTQWSLSAISASATVTDGSGIVVAVIDSGVNANHPDLQGQVMNGVDYRDGISFVNSDGSINSCVSYTANPDPNKPDHPDFGKYDPTGHGTHVAGIIAGKGINVQGVASGVQIMPIRVIGPTGTGDSSDVACGIIYAVDNNADVINLSLGSSERDAATAAAVAYAHEQGVVVVAAVGNNADACNKSVRNLPNYPAAEPNVIGVAAIEPDGIRASYSTTGPQVDIAAPGSSILSTFLGSNYSVASGTSMAAPHVAAVAALLLADESDLNPNRVYDRLTSSAFNPGNAYSQTLGHGIVNAAAALTETRATTQETFSGTKPANLPIPACILAEIEQEASDRAAAERAAAEKAAADALAASLPVVKKSLKVKALKKKRISIKVAAPAGSKTLVQRKVGKKWRTVITTTAVPSMVVKVSKSGSYRVRIVIPTGTINSKTYRVR